MNKEISAHYLSEDKSFTATEAVRKFAHIRHLATKHPVHIHTNSGDQQTLLSREFFDDLIAAKRPDEEEVDYGTKLDLVLDSVDTYILILDREMKIRRINLALRRALGIPNIPLNTPSRLIKVTPYHEYVLDRAEDVIRTGQAQRFESRAPYTENQIRNVRILPWQHGVAIFSDDVTSTYAMRKARFREQAQAETLSLFGDLGQGIFDGNGRLAEANQALADMIEAQDAETVIGTRFLSLFALESRDLLEKNMFERDKPTKYDVELIAGGTHRRPCQLALSAYWDKGDGRSHSFAIRPLQ